MDEALRLQKQRERVHRWRASKRQAGNDMLTIWLPRELKLYIEDMALKRHCSPSDLIQKALTTCYPLSADVTVTITDTNVTDTSQLRLMLQQELRAFFGDSPLSLVAAPAETVTDTVTDTSPPAVPGADTLPPLEHVTDPVTDTGSAPAGKRQAPARQRTRQAAPAA